MAVSLTPYFKNLSGVEAVKDALHVRPDGTFHAREVHAAVFDLATKLEELTKAAALKKDASGKIDPSAEEQKKTLLGQLKTEIAPYLAAQPDGKKTAFMDALRAELFDRDKRDAAGQLITADGAPGGKIADSGQLQAELFKGISDHSKLEAQKAKKFLKPTTSSILNGITAMAEDAAAYEAAAYDKKDPQRKKFRKKCTDNMQAYISQQFSEMPPGESVWDFYAEMTKEARKKRRAATEPEEAKMYHELVKGLKETKDLLFKNGYAKLTWEEALKNTGAGIVNEAGKYLGTPMEVLTRPFMNLADGIHENRHHLLTVGIVAATTVALVGGPALAVGVGVAVVGAAAIGVSWLAKRAEGWINKGLEKANNAITGVKLDKDGKPLRTADDLQKNRSLSFVDLVRGVAGYDVALKDGKAPKGGYTK